MKELNLIDRFKILIGKAPTRDLPDWVSQSQPIPESLPSNVIPYERFLEKQKQINLRRGRN